MYRARPGRNKVNSLAANDKVVCRRRVCVQLLLLGINHSPLLGLTSIFISFRFNF